MLKLRSKILKKLKKILNQDFFIPFKGLKNYDLIIYDNIYPHPVSGFRLEEFTVLLKEFKSSKILTTNEGYSILKTPKNEHKVHIKNLISNNRELKNKINIKKGFVNINTKLFYCIFINNIYNNIDWLEKYKIPFIFTLYPGGGFKLYDSICDQKLNRVFNSPSFRKVIVTQLFTKNYLIENNLCNENNIELIFGGVVPQNSLNKNISLKKKYLINKKTLDICFCAAKYMPLGKDKGYDVFIEFAQNIVKKYDFINFHIVGGFSKDDIDIRNFEDKIFFYGYKNFVELNEFFNTIDIIVSPNKPFVLNKGSFDGFPLGTVVEAVLNEVVAIVSDELNENKLFVNNEDIVIIKSNSLDLEEKIIDLIENPKKLYSISQNGMEKFRHIYSNQYQIKPRIDIIKKQLK